MEVVQWGVISLEAKTELHVFNRPYLKVDLFVREIQEQYDIPFAPFIEEWLIFMHDNARPHIANCVQHS